MGLGGRAGGAVGQHEAFAHKDTGRFLILLKRGASAKQREVEKADQDEPLLAA